MKMRFAVVAATTFLSGSLTAQSAAEHIALGDREYAAGKAPEALKHYQAALGVDAKNAEALWRASRTTVDIGEFADEKTRDSLYKVADGLARRGVMADSNSAMTHFALAKAIGRYALTLGTRDRVKYAGDVRAEALKSIAIDSVNPGSYHVMGMWNANIMRLSGISRFLAKNLLGGKTFGEANWDAAARYLERAAAIEPERIIHRVELAGVYRDRNEKDKARAELQKAISLKAVEYNDKHYQYRAQKELAELK